MNNNDRHEIIDEWINRLRSKKYVQDKHSLNYNNEKYCCLGILCQIALEKKLIDVCLLREDNCYVYNTVGYKDNTAIDIPNEFCKDLGIHVYGRYNNVKNETFTLISHNDDDGLSFEQIADIIEHNKNQFMKNEI